MNLLVTLAITALVGGSAIFVSSVAPGPAVHVEENAQAKAAAYGEAHVTDNEAETTEASEVSFGTKVKSFFHLGSSDEATIKGETSTEGTTDVNTDASVDLNTETNARGSALIDINL